MDAPSVSARHGLFQFDDGEVRFTDLGSRNGTTLDGASVAAGVPAVVGAGAELRIGTLRIAVARGAALRPPDASAPVAPGAITALLERLARPPAFDAAEVAAGSLRPGLVLGRFELVREIGRGGFGIVFAARDRALGREVALKAMRPGVAGAGLGEGWLAREAEAAAQLNHPNIVSLHDVGTWEGVPYLIMELLRGEPLDARLARGPLPPAGALAVAIDVARALAHAHAAGVVHRDLKPSNVFLVEEGWAKVLDFGLAHMLGAAAPLRAGTPRYMPPEQRRGESIDVRADVYSAALVLHEALGGALPEEDGAGLGPCPAAPGPVAALLARALAPSPAARPAHGRAWLDLLLGAQREIARDEVPA